MRLVRAALCAATLCVAAVAANAQGSLLPLPDEKPIRGMNTPGLSTDGKTLSFSYIGDLWTVPAKGGTATRLTVHEAHDAYPRFSPDGRWIAFSSNRDGNYDVFVISANGGPARQLTFNSANDYVMDWSADGNRVMFYGMRGAETWQLYSVDVKSGAAKSLTNDDQYLRYAVYSPDGGTIAYDRAGSVGTWWRPRYHGSANMDIYTKSLSTGKITRVTDYDGTDLWPMYAADGRTIYYASDRLTPGTPNILASPASGGKPAQVTKHKGDAVRWPAISRDGSTIAYLYGGDLYTVKTTGGEPAKLNIFAPSDDKTNMVSRLNLTNSATEVEVAPDGKTLALVVRGEIWTIPSDKGGDAKRLTKRPAHDYDIYWTKDGKSIVFTTDKGGNFDVYTINVETKEEKALSTDPNDETNPKLSPDGKLVSFLRSGAQGGIYVVPVDGSGQPTRVAESHGNNLEFGVGINSYSWSPDSKWLAFSRRDAIDTADIWVVPVTGGQAINVTYYPGSNVNPDWSGDGKHLLFVSTRGGGMDIYSIPLQREKEDKEEEAKPTPPGGPGGQGNQGGAGGQAGQGGQPGQAGQAAKPDDKKPVEVKINFEDIDERAKRITTQGAGGFVMTPDGKSAVFVSISGGTPDYYMVPAAGGTAQRMTGTGEGTGLPRYGTDPNLFYALGAGGTVKVVRRMGPMWMAQPVAFAARMDFDRRAEIRQAFNEFWRRVNVGFYDPNMHGVDWKAMRARYEPLLEGVATKEEFAMYLLSAMVGELNSSHSEISPAGGTTGPQTAELGIKFDENYAGPGLKVVDYLQKGPNDDLGPKVKPGQYVLAIDGEDVQWNEQMYQTLQDKAGKTVELLVSDKPSKEGAKTVKIKPVTNDAWRDLEYERKVRVAREQVDKLSGGRLGYVHIKGMNQPALRRLERELWGKNREKDGLVIDIRNNTGGNTHDQILAQISRPVYGYEQPRDAPKTTQPERAWGKPIILLMNQNSVSDGEIFPMGFRNLKLGKIVGVATPGYVIGTYPGVLQDGTQYRIPMWGWYTKEGKNMENNGVQPDITVEVTPEDIQAKRDRQLEVAVTELLKDVPKRVGANP
jgi:tricorn protease